MRESRKCELKYIGIGVRECGVCQTSSKLVSPFHDFTEQLLPCPVIDPYPRENFVLSEILLQKLHKRAKTMDNKEQSPGDRVAAHLDGPDVETLVEWKELCDGEAGKVGPCHLNHLEGGGRCVLGGRGEVRVGREGGGACWEGGGRCVLGGKGRGQVSCKDQGTNDFPPS